MTYEPVIGLEVHAELNTKTKMYCACENRFGGKPNTRICPICLGMPGVLPALNRDAVISAIRAGLMMGCRINRKTRQYRKHYLYPDLPKGYQISQYKIPLCVNGHFQYLSNDVLKHAEIRQIHIEEDAGKLVHGEQTMVDYNRCGVPLIEIVTEPCFHSAEDVHAFLESVRIMLLYLGISDCRMQEGSLRCDVNVSLREKGIIELSPRVEMKNINTFSGVERSIVYEITRQKQILFNGDRIEPETRRWDDVNGCSFTLRNKENAQDYRFMPEPDIPTIFIDEKTINICKQSIPESETARRLRYQKEYYLSAYDARELTRELPNSAFFESCISLGAEVKSCANWLLSDVARLCNQHECSILDSKLKPQDLYDILQMILSSKISASGGKRALEELFVSDEKLDEVVSRLNLIQLTDECIYREIVSEVLDENQKAVTDYLSGKTSVLGFFTGQCMRRSKSRGDPARFRKIIEDSLKEKR